MIQIEWYFDTELLQIRKHRVSIEVSARQCRREVIGDEDGPIK